MRITLVATNRNELNKYVMNKIQNIIDSNTPDYDDESGKYYRGDTVKTMLEELEKQLKLCVVSKSFYCIASNCYDGFTNVKCDKQCEMCNSGQ